MAGLPLCAICSIDPELGEVLAGAKVHTKSLRRPVWLCLGCVNYAIENNDLVHVDETKDATK